MSATASSLAASPARAASAVRRHDWFALGVLGLLWLELAARLQMEWSVNPQYGYGWTVPFLAAFILWRRSTVAPVPLAPANRWLPLVLIAGSVLSLLPVRLIQEANPDWRLLSWTMAGAVTTASLSAIYLAGGRSWLRHFAFPVLFFLVAVPWPTQLEQLLIQGLMRADAAINVEVLNAIGISAVQLGNVIEVGTGFIGINEACTGIRSLQATFMVSLFLGELYDFTVRRRFLLVGVGAALAFACNLARTFLLVWLGAEHGSATIKNWHDPAGMTILMVCMFALWGLSLLLRGPETPRRSARIAAPSGRPISRVLLGFLLTWAVVVEGGTEAWYRAHEAGTIKTSPWTVAWPTSASDYKPIAVAEEAQELLRYNEGGGAVWKDDEAHRWNMYFFRWLPGRTAGLFIKNHRPDICLPASGMTQRGGVRNELLMVNGAQLPIRSYVFENGNETLHVYYCYWDGTAPKPEAVNSEDWTASGRLQAVRHGKRDVGTQMLEIVVWGCDEDAAAEAALRKQLGEIIRT